MEIEAIKGKVIRVAEASSKLKNITIISSKDQSKKEIEFYFNIPIRTGDTILTEKYSTKTIGKREIIKLSEFPIVLIGMDENSTKSSIFKAMKGVDSGNIFNITNVLSNEAKESNKSLFNKISEISCILMNKSKLEQDDYIRNYYYSGNNNVEGIEKLFKNWLKHNVWRQFQLFGFNKYEIKDILKYNCNYNNITKLTYDFLEDPFSLFVIKKDKLIEWCQRLYKFKINDSKYNILSEIYKNFKNGMNGYSIEQLNNIEKNIDISKKIEICKEYMNLLDNHFYFKNIYKKEEYIRNRIKLINTKSKDIYDEETIENTYCNDLSKDQKDAIKGSIKNNMSVICGAAGTGKTTILRRLVQIFENDGKKVVIAAFTGKAVARLKECLSRDDPCTIHILLWSKQITTEQKFDCLIIDEASMVSMGLMNKIFNKFLHKFSLYLIGDDSQLPPIQWGRPFYDIIKSGTVNVYELTTCHRFYNKDGEVNGIIENARGIRDERDKWEIKQENNFNILTNAGVSCIISKMIENKISYHDFTILSPFNAMLPKINALASEMFLKGEKEVIEPVNGKGWRIGDRVIHKINNYAINIMNGDEGIVCEWMKSKEDEKIIGLIVKFGKMEKSRNIEFPFQKHNINEETGRKIIRIPSEEESYMSDSEEEEKIEVSTYYIDRSYALTIHKSQGSEWNHILLYMGNGYNGNQIGNSSFLTRNLLYTGITRARETVTILSNNIYSVNKYIKNETNFGNDALLKLLRK